MKSPNIIYPVNETTFVHILPDPDDVRNYYIPIEPSFLHSVSQILPAIEMKLIDLIDGLEDDPISDKERAEVIKKMLAAVAVILRKEPMSPLTGNCQAAGSQVQDHHLPQHRLHCQEEDEGYQEEAPGAAHTRRKGHPHR